MAFQLNARSRANLNHVHPDLVRIVERAAEISNRPFVVIDGARTIAEQRENVRKGASKTMRSRHVIAKNGYAHAVDIVIIEGGKALWDAYQDVRRPMEQAACELGIPLEWGGSWRSFQDTPHYQLPWADYPGELPTRLATSRVVQGSAAAGAGGIATLYDAAPQLVDQLTQADSQLKTGTLIGVVIGAVTLAGALYALYARWDDAGRPLPGWWPWAPRLRGQLSNRPVADGDPDDPRDQTIDPGQMA
jgi:peptidoglycan L-alanyl-D-glutamate endopeptidase CwlK